ncbi:MAG: acetylglutamate kinase [Cyclobacteriaceae bacterium]|jgi:acetylglutamate kinase|nr:acetylglutamate kinase [Cyclobacteriaceae bacterium]
MQKLYIIKIGGNVLDDETALATFLKDFANIQYPKILIHGGGKIATKIGHQLGIESNYINGRRITDEPTRDLVTMVYGGLINKQIVTQLQAHQCNAMGLTGADGNVIKATRRPVGEIDFGFVGDIVPKDVNTSFLYFLLKQNIIPVFAPLTYSPEHGILNTNADTIASVLAVALSKHFQIRVVYCFEKKGVLADIENETSVIKNIDSKAYAELLEQKVLFDGILPKLENAFDAIQNGVNEILIGSASDLSKNMGEETEGTLIKK